MLHFIPINKDKTVFKAVKVLKNDAGAIVIGDYIPASCVVAYCNKHY